MAVTPDEVGRIAALAMLRLDDDELDTITGQLNVILDHVDALGSLDTAEVEAFHDGTVGAPLRPDEPGADPLASEPGTDAPGWDSGFFTVPRLLRGPADAGDGARGAGPADG